MAGSRSGRSPWTFTTTSAVAGQLLAAEKYGLGFDFLEKYKKEVAAVTPEDVQAVAKKYLDPKTLTLVAGELARIRTGVAHAYRTVKPGKALEFSPARFDPADTIRHPLV